MQRVRQLTGLILLAAGGYAADSNLAAIRSTGIYDPDGTVLYSVYVASRAARLGDLAVNAAVPPGTRFLESVDVPRGAVYEGVAGNLVAWSIPQLEEDTLIGPFTFRVKLDGSRPDVPAAVEAAAAYQRPETGIVEYRPEPARLEPLADSGSLTFDQRGTRDRFGENAPVAVGATGVLIFVPEGAVTERTTLTIRRRVVNDENLPKTAAGTWWCGHYDVVFEPLISSQKEISFAFPTRRDLSPGLNVRMFGSGDQAEWRELTSPPPQTVSEPGAASVFGFGGGFNQFGGGCTTAPFGFTTCSGGLCGLQCGFGGGLSQFGFGVSNTDRTVASVTGRALSSQFGSQIQAADIVDGTSNTIIAILIGRR